MVSTAFVTGIAVMVVTLEIRIDTEFAFQKGGDDLIHIARSTADQLDSGFRQRHLSSAADASADQQIHTAFLQQPRQRAVSGLAAGEDPFRNDLALFDREDRKFRRMPEMLKDFVVFACDRNFHSISSCFWDLTVCFGTKPTAPLAADRL